MNYLSESVSLGIEYYYYRYFIFLSERCHTATIKVIPYLSDRFTSDIEPVNIVTGDNLFQLHSVRFS